MPPLPPHTPPPAHPDEDPVDQIRAASRQLVRELGFLHPTLAASHYGPSAVHALIETDLAGTLTAGELSHRLGLEKSTVSRLLGKLLQAGEIQAQQSPRDGREKLIALTLRGRETAAALHAFGRKQVVGALQHLAPGAEGEILTGLRRYGEGLTRQRRGEAGDGAHGTPTAHCPGLRIHSGYLPGAVGSLAELHARYYSRKAQFGAEFEALVARELAAFVTQLADGRNGLWLVVDDHRRPDPAIVGGIAIAAPHGPGAPAKLRWFILHESARGQGLGQALMAQATAHCDARGFARCELRTFQGLDAARHIYEAAGFRLAEEAMGEQWGAPVLEQRLVRPLPRPPGGV